MPDFSKAKVGDRVYSLLNGWGEIVNIYVGEEALGMVRFGECLSIIYCRHGKLHMGDKLPDLYWDEVTLNIPESALTPPKRKVKKWILLDKQRQLDAIGQYRTVATEKLAQTVMLNHPLQYEGPFEIEVEE